MPTTPRTPRGRQVAEPRRAFYEARLSLAGPTRALRPRTRPAAGVNRRHLSLALREGGPTCPSEPPLPTEVTEGPEAPPALLRGPSYSRSIPLNSVDSRDARDWTDAVPAATKVPAADCWN